MGDIERRLQDPKIVELRLQKKEREQKLIITDLASAKVPTYPTLFDTKHSGLNVRFFHRTGEIFIPSYPEREIKPHEVDPAKYHVVKSTGAKPTKVIYQKWARYRDIETAIRAASHIYEKHESGSGEVAENTRRLLDFSQYLLDVVRVDSPTLERLGELTTEVETRLMELGFARAIKPVKKRLAEQLIVGSGVDSMGRINKLISRTRIASAWLKIVEEIVFNMRVEDKYSRLEFALGNERSLERFYLKQTLGWSEKLIEAPEDDPEFTIKYRHLRSFSHRYLDSTHIKAAPYRVPSLVFTKYLFGSVTEAEKRLFGMLQIDPQMTHELFRPISPDAPTLDFKEKLNRGMIILQAAMAVGDDKI
jgi:hypothetical protein